MPLEYRCVCLRLKTHLSYGKAADFKIHSLVKKIFSKYRLIHSIFKIWVGSLILQKILEQKKLLYLQVKLLHIQVDVGWELRSALK